jgi:hypothetical protein
VKQPIDTFFEGVAQTEHPTSQGACALPILYRDCEWFGLFYRVDLAKARALVPDTRIEPWPIFGKAVLALFVYQYHDTSIGPYGELGVGFQCRRAGSAPSLFKLARDMGAQDTQGVWVTNLPVTTPAACAAGRELWGYPKYVTSITTEFTAEAASVRLGDELNIVLPTPQLIKLKGQATTTFTARGDDLVRTVVGVDHDLTWGSGNGTKLELLGEGPTATTLRALGVQELNPLAAARCDGFRAILPAGVTQS